MKWFKHWVANKCREAWEEARQDSEGLVPAKNASRLHAIAGGRTFDSDGGLSIQLFKAIGGRIVIFNNYNEKIDRNTRTTYLITDEQDFEKELSKIITLESMRQ